MTTLPAGFALGAALGAYFASPGLGMSLGLMLGATVSTWVDFRSGKRSVVWPTVGALASLWTLCVFLVERL